MAIRSFVGLEPGSCGHHRPFVIAAILVGLAVIQGIVQVQPATGSVNVSLGLCHNLVLPWGYPCNEYTVQTAGEFLLGVQNIPKGLTRLQSTTSQRGPVFLQHGIMTGGDNWLFNEPSQSLGFLLADAGYNVWIGNIRGIVWGKGHVNLTTSDPEFWDWLWDELAAYDLPAMLEFVFQQTQSKIMYIGHSQETTMLMAGLVGTAQSQALTNMLGGVVLICPIAYLKNISSSFDITAADLYVDKIFDVFGIDEFNLYK